VTITDSTKEISTEHRVLAVISSLLLCCSTLDATAQDDYERCQAQFGVSGAIEIDELTTIASSGHIEAQYCLGVALHDGKGVERNPTKAIEWYEKAGEKGHYASQYWLCLMYKDGIGAKVSSLEARYWCQRAGNSGNPEGMYAMGLWYLSSVIRDRDVRAYIWFLRAANAGEPEARAMLELLTTQLTELQIREAIKLEDQGEQ
jgi:TPR repeat protein